MNADERPVGVERRNRSVTLFSHCWFESFGKRVENPTPSGVVGSPTPGGVELEVAPAPPAPDSPIGPTPPSAPVAPLPDPDFEPDPLARGSSPVLPITPVQPHAVIAPARTANDTPPKRSIKG